MQVTLRVIDPEKKHPGPDVEVYEQEMTEGEFVEKVADVFHNHPEILKLSLGQGEYIHAPTFAFILDQDPVRFKERGELDKKYKITHYPSGVKVRETCDGKLLQVTMCGRDENKYYFCRIKGNKVKYLPYPDECGVSGTDSGRHAFGSWFNVNWNNPMYPWIAFYPEKFAGLVEFCEILDPDDENPLTGLVSAKDAPVRTLAKQVASKLQRARDQWAEDIISTL